MFTDLIGLKTFLLVLDSGTLVLIWTVQWMIYPSFPYYSREDFLPWHNKYAPRMGRIAGPLMVLQVLGYAFLLVEDFGALSIAKCICVGITWVMTMGIFVPLHTKISRGHYDESDLKSLISKNYIRSWSWTLLFVLEVLSFTRFG